MTDAKMLFGQRKTIAFLTKQKDQLEQLAIAQNNMLEELVSVACAWAFDMGRGVVMMTEAEVLAVLKEHK